MINVRNRQNLVLPKMARCFLIVVIGVGGEIGPKKYVNQTTSELDERRRSVCQINSTIRLDSSTEPFLISLKVPKCVFFHPKFAFLQSTVYGLGHCLCH